MKKAPLSADPWTQTAANSHSGSSAPAAQVLLLTSESRLLPVSMQQGSTQQGQQSIKKYRDRMQLYKPADACCAAQMAGSRHPYVRAHSSHFGLLNWPYSSGNKEWAWSAESHLCDGPLVQLQRGQAGVPCSGIPQLDGGILAARGDGAFGGVPVAGLHVPPVPCQHCFRLQGLEVPHLREGALAFQVNCTQVASRSFPLAVCCQMRHPSCIACVTGIRCPPCPVPMCLAFRTLQHTCLSQCVSVWS